MLDAATPFDAAAGELSGISRILPLEGRRLFVERGGRALVADVDAAFDGTAITVIMGPNGAGKTLLLKVLAGLLRPDGGAVTWAGSPPDRARAAKLGFVFQRPVMLRRSALNNVRYALWAQGVPIRDRRIRAFEALKRASLAHLANTPARVLSGGEQQRLAIARVLATEPDVLLLDEPTSSLDPASTLAIETLVRDAREQGTKIVFVTHDIGQARRLADEVVFMAGGRIAERAPASKFFASPRSEAAHAFLHGRIAP